MTAIEDKARTLTELADRVEALSEEDARIVGRLDRSGECWLWTGKLDARGRGRVWRAGKLTLHHRAIWQALIGPIPDGALLCHHCDNPQCANPAHLYIGDNKSNAADMFERGRAWQQTNPELARQLGSGTGRRNNWSAGSKNPKAKLTPRQVAEIVASPKASRELGLIYGVHPTTIQRIKKGASWTS